MDIDPLQDYSNPRYAVESDDSDDELFDRGTASASGTKASVPDPVVPTGATGGNTTLVALVGRAGEAWAAGLDSDVQEKAAPVKVGDVEVGWLDASTLKGVTLVSISHDLPSLHAVALAEALLTLKPSSVTILDTYASPSYISSTPPSSSTALPIRYLRTSSSSSPSPLSKSILPFDPPNLIQGLSASLLSHLESSTSAEGVLLLLPSRHIPPPPPRTSAGPRALSSSSFSASGESWTDETLSLVSEAIGGGVSWSLENLAKHGSGKRTTSGGRRERGREFEAGMYI